MRMKCSVINITSAVMALHVRNYVLMVSSLMLTSDVQTNAISRSTLTAVTEQNFVSQLTKLGVSINEINSTEPARGTNDYCPRKNGFFAHPDPIVCDLFYQCIEGEYTENKCAAGLHFDEYSGTCVWPATANREGCHEAKKELKDGFSCPADKQKNDANGQIVAHPHFTHPEGKEVNLAA